MAARKPDRPSWTRGAALSALLVALSLGGGTAHRAERAADIQVEINGDLTTTKYLTTTRPLPTGVLLSTAPTFVSDGTTSEYTTLVIGTVANGFYSRIVSTAERVFYAIPRSGDRPQPTGVVSEAVSTEVQGGATTVHRTRYIRTSLGASYGQVIERSSSVVPELQSSQAEPEELLPTVTVGEPPQYASFAPHFTAEPVELNEIPQARRVVEGEEIIIVDDVAHPDTSRKILPTYTADGNLLVLNTPLVVVPNRASFEKTQELLNEKVNKMVKDLGLEEQSTRVSRDFNDLETIEILEDLALSGSELTTVTYVGFSDFVTTIGSTVVVFMPQSAGAAKIREKMSKTAGPNFVGPTRAGKDILLSRAPVFIPNRGDVITTTRTFVSHDKMGTKTVEGHDIEVKKNMATLVAGRPVETVVMNKDEGTVTRLGADSVVSDNANTNVLSTASTRVYNTVDLYPTGLVTSIGGTVARDKVTTVFTTLVYGTFIKGRYAKVVKSTSSIYYLVSKTDSFQPTPVVQAAPSTLPIINNSLGRAVGSSAAAQVIVASADEAKAALKNSQLEGSIDTSSAPALFSSQADSEEEKSVLKTYYTTFTYFTTLSSGGSTEVKTSLSTVTSVATEGLQPAPLTYFPPSRTSQRPSWMAGKPCPLVTLQSRRW
ncbi:uncharacterized protein LOC119102352 [Pollicipes pollicipes]|uniref:uncharacterized protein LOC119102352 n=1 Tax=Pollicipes pollicipes TaxID=41117 RepID=UPI001884DD66|nr:uncharacterized protein LOC119102352 [Pollicipes pollicipes]